MGSNTTISLEEHFENFIEYTIKQGRFSTAGEVVRAGLRLLEEEESKFQAIRYAIQEGIDSGSANNFDPKKHLAKLKNDKMIK